MPTTPRDRILAAATRLFEADGVQAVGINRIIAEADVAPMTLYRQFGSKDELVAAALEQWSVRWLHWLTARLDRYGNDPERRFAGLWDALEEWLHSEEFRGSLVANAATELRGKPHHPAHGAIARHRAAVRHLLEDLARMAGAVDPEGLAEQLHVVVEGALAAAAVERRSAGTLGVHALANAALACSVTPHDAVP